MALVQGALRDAVQPPHFNTQASITQCTLQREHAAAPTYQQVIALQQRERDGDERVAVGQGVQVKGAECPGVYLCGMTG